MALLTSPDMLPEGTRFLTRALVATKGKPVDRDELTALVAPPGLAEAMTTLVAVIDDDAPDDADEREQATTGDAGNEAAQRSLDALRTLGVVDIAKNEVALSEVTARLWSRPEHVTPRAFRAFMLDRFLQTADPQAAPDSIEGVMDLVHALDLFYTAEEPMRPMARFKSGPKGPGFAALQTAALGIDDDLWPVRNATRWTPFVRWACYLGLARNVSPSAMVPDASTALALRLSSLESRTYRASEFVAQCAAAVPLLDGGALQRTFTVEWTGDTQVISPALSISLLQLEADGAVTFSKQSDSGVCVLRTRPDRSTDKPVTSIEWTANAERGAA